MSGEGWRPIHRSLADESLALIRDVIGQGWRPGEIHLALVTDDDPQQFRTACGDGLGQWITGVGAQVTCPECLQTVHA